ncbi:hypothetical protein CO046_01310 [Candidatus Peregrinibacteria bacterium CG_4_9_14_0_2_um_filter_53_11]|nr:MAG: hypothetical protein CO046_01310 [Candidatus Peregrinibacteria bacterium CG_4_9_14_0_2_um_filter_53_11]
MRKRTIALGLIPVVVIGVVAYRWYKASTAPLPYEYITIAPTELSQEVTVTGRVEAIADVDLAFEASGRVTQLNVRVGDRVEEGQVLAALDDASFASRLKENQAAVAAAETQVAQQRAGLRAETARFDQLQRGGSSQQIQSSDLRRANSQRTVEDRRQALQLARQKADLDVAQNYASVIDVVESAYSAADQAVRLQTAELFTKEDFFSRYKLSFQSCNINLGQKVIDQRNELETTLTDWQGQVAGASVTETFEQLDTLLQDAAENTRSVRNFLDETTTLLLTECFGRDPLPATYRTQVAAALGAINGARTQLNSRAQQLETQQLTQASAIQSAQAQLREAENALATSSSDAQNTRSSARPEELAAQVAKIDQVRAAIGAQQAQVVQAQARLENLLTEQRKLVVVAPITGVVSKADVKLGEFASPGSPVFRVLTPTLLKVEIDVPEADVAKIHNGDEAEVTLDAYGSDLVFKAYVTSIEPAASLAEGVPTYKTTVMFESADPRIKPGMTADLDIFTAHKEEVLAVPARAVQTREDGTDFVQVLDADDKLQEVNVTTGLRGSDGRLEILSGLSVGDRVVTFIEED